MNKLIGIVITLLTAISASAYTKVAIIDNFDSYHGKAVYNLISENTVSIEIDKFNFNGKDVDIYYSHLETILKGDYDFLNLSLGHYEYDGKEAELLRKIADKGTKIITASGNENKKLSSSYKVFPCMLPIENLYCVGAGKESKAPASNFGRGVSFFVDGSFNEHNVSSFATPRFLSILVKLSKIKDVKVESILESRSKNVNHLGENITIIDFSALSTDLNYLYKNQSLDKKGSF